MGNAVLGDWTGPFGVPPFAMISDADFAPGFDAALAEARVNVAAIAGAAEGATFANTIEALELSERALSRVAGVFYNLVGADSTPAREALQSALAPKLSAFASEVTNNKGLFGRIEDLWQRREDLGLEGEQARVLELYRRMFVRSGAMLQGDEAARLTEVKSQLAVLGTRFSQNLLADERAWFMELGEADLVGLPEFVVASARAAGVEKGVGGAVVTLSRSLIVPFLQFSPRRPCAKRPMRRGLRGGRMVARPTTGPLRPRY